MQWLEHLPSGSDERQHTVQPLKSKRRCIWWTAISFHFVHQSTIDVWCNKSVDRWAVERCQWLVWSQTDWCDSEDWLLVMMQKTWMLTSKLIRFQYMVWLSVNPAIRKTRAFRDLDAWGSNAGCRPVSGSISFWMWSRTNCVTLKNISGIYPYILRRVGNYFHPVTAVLLQLVTRLHGMQMWCLKHLLSSHAMYALIIRWLPNSIWRHNQHICRVFIGIRILIQLRCASHVEWRIP